MEKEKAEIANLVARYDRVQSLMKYVNNDTLKESYKKQPKGKAVGVDGVTKEQYGENLDENIENLLIRMKKFSYRPYPVRRAFIPKGNGKSHWGKYCVLHRTSKKKLKMKREAIKKWLWEHMHESIKDTIEALNVRLTGHYRYYGIYGNFVGLLKFYKYVLVELRKSKRRRDQTNWLTWNKYINILKIHPLECPKIYLNSAY